MALSDARRAPLPRARRALHDGLIDYALGPPSVRAARDVLATATRLPRKLFRDRIVLVGDVRAADRVGVPVNLAGWESGGHSRRAWSCTRNRCARARGRARRSRAAARRVLVTLAALLVLMRDWRMALATAFLAALALSSARRGAAAASLSGIVAPSSPRSPRRCVSLDEPQRPSDGLRIFRTRCDACPLRRSGAGA
jgi:hypothetical protein